MNYQLNCYQPGAIMATETVFDHHITENEQKALFGYVLSPEDVEFYKIRISNDGAYALLYHLYRLRGDMKKAEEFLNKIKDPLHALSVKGHTS